MSTGVSVVYDPKGPVRTPDPREFFAVPRTGPPGAYETRIPPGQTGEATNTAQLPFDAGHMVRVRAGASVGVLQPGALFSTRATSVQVDIPLEITPATSADALKLELAADRQQWCLRATDSRGAQPTGPLFLALTVRGGSGTAMTSGLPSATGDAWAMRWTQMGGPVLPASGAATLTVWVGGPHYVTARAEATISSGP